MKEKSPKTTPDQSTASMRPLSAIQPNPAPQPPPNLFQLIFQDDSTKSLFGNMTSDAHATIQSSFKTSAPVLQKAHAPFNKSPSCNNDCLDASQLTATNYHSSTINDSRIEVDDKTSSVLPRKLSMRDSLTGNALDNRTKRFSAFRERNTQSPIHSRSTNLTSTSTVRLPDICDTTLPYSSLDEPIKTQTEASSPTTPQTPKKRHSPAAESVQVYSRTADALLQIPEDMGSQELEHFRSLALSRAKDQRLMNGYAQQTYIRKSGLSLYKSLPNSKQAVRDSSFINVPIHEVLFNANHSEDCEAPRPKPRAQKKLSIWQRLKRALGFSTHKRS